MEKENLIVLQESLLTESVSLSLLTDIIIEFKYLTPAVIS